MDRKLSERASLISTALRIGFAEEGISLFSGRMQEGADILHGLIPDEDGTNISCSVFVDIETGEIRIYVTDVFSDIPEDLWAGAVVFCNSLNKDIPSLKFVFCAETKEIVVLSTISAEVPNSCIGEVVVPLYGKMIETARVIREANKRALKDNPDGNPFDDSFPSQK